MPLFQKKKEISVFVKVAISLLMAGSMLYFKGWLDTLMIGAFLSEIDVGVYNIALKLSNLIALPLTAINIIVAPKFAEHFENKDQLQNIVTISTRLIFYTTLPIFLVIIIFGNFILSIFGSNFEQGYMALIIISCGALVNALSGSVGYFLQMTGKQVFYQNITIITSVFIFVLNMLLIPWLGIIGAAITSLLSQVIWNATMVFYIKCKVNLITFYWPFSLGKFG